LYNPIDTGRQFLDLYKVINGWVTNMLHSLHDSRGDVAWLKSGQPW
jgi:hypothetical protein